MDRIIIFLILSVPIIIFSWRTLFTVKSHGFYRFFAWECMAWLLASNIKLWFYDWLSVNQIFSWIILIIAAYMVIAGMILMKNVGKPSKNRATDTLFEFEQTTELIDIGIFKYIRHPLYGSLILLTWGIFLKKPTIELFVVSVIASIFLYLTARFDEKECIAYFGDKYRQYMRRSKMFIPYLF